MMRHPLSPMTFVVVGLDTGLLQKWNWTADVHWVSACFVSIYSLYGHICWTAYVHTDPSCARTDDKVVIM